MTTETKNLGHYEGEVEIPTEQDLKMMDPTHKELYRLNQRKVIVVSELNEINEKIKKILDLLNKLVIEGEKEYDWIWVYEVGRGKPKWKEEFINHLGSLKAEQVANKYKSQKFKQLGIKFIDPIPDTIKQIKNNPPKIPIRKFKLKRNV